MAPNQVVHYFNGDKTRCGERFDTKVTVANAPPCYYCHRALGMGA